MKLQVPENITLQWEAWRGFGLAALIPSALITGIAILLAVLLCTAVPREGGSIAAVMAVGLTFAFCVGLFSKLENNQSIWDALLRTLRYRREQQVFLYSRGKENVRYAEES